MAPRRSGGSSGFNDDDGGSGIRLEETITLDVPEYPDGLRESMVASASLSAVFTVLIFILFVWSIVLRRKWRTVPESRFLTMMIWITLFWFVYWGLNFGSYLAPLLNATVFESWVLVSGWLSTFNLLAEILLIATFYYILHNRLRSVGVPKKTVSLLAVFNWMFLVIILILDLVLLGGDWAFCATNLYDMKNPDYYGDGKWFPFLQSKFYRVDYLNVAKAMHILRLFMQVEMVALGIMVLCKIKNNSGALKAMIVFFIGSLVTYIISPIVLINWVFKYTGSNIVNVPLWVDPVYTFLRCFAEFVCLLSICIFAVMTDRDQWQLGTKRDVPHGPAVGAGEIYKNNADTYQYPPQPPSQGYPPPPQGYPPPSQGYPPPPQGYYS